MKKLLLIGLVLILSGCHTLTAALIGGGIGGAIGGGRGAVIGAAIGAGIGGEADILEEKAARRAYAESRAARAASREPKVVDLGNGKKVVIVHGRPAGTRTGSQNQVFSGADCGIFQTPNEQAECERGKRYAEDKLRRERERRAYEYGQYGGGH